MEDYLIVGSGFGGAVSAMRLAEKGYGVTVLEAGKRWGPEDFPKTNWDMRKFFWAPGIGCHGIQRMRMFTDFLALGGAGVGGGSLVYACVLMEPLDPFFKDPQWADLDPDWKAALQPHYETAKRMLGAARTPKFWKGDELLKEYAEEIGRGADFFATDVGIYFSDEPGKTAPDPFFGGEGPERTSCDFSAGYLVGCRTGAKNSLDKNYLYFAEKLGARIVPETLVTAIRPDGQGGYVVESRRSTSAFPRGRKTFFAKNVVVAAGALGTLELLLHCKRENYLPYLSDRLGRKFRTNSENITSVDSCDKRVNFAEGVAISSIAKVNDRTSIELVRYHEGSDAMGLVTTVLRMRRPFKFLWTLLTHPVEFAKAMNPFGWAKRTLIFLVMQVVDNSLDMVYRRSRLRPWRRVLKSDSSKGRIPAYLPEATHCAESIAAKIDGVPSSRWSKVLLNKSITAHVMGGCSMGFGPEEGVVDKHGRVFGHPGLYIADGSIVSANLGVNPSLTITALAEHVMSAIPPKG